MAFIPANGAYRGTLASAPGTTVVRLNDCDIALLAEAYAFAQFNSELNLPKPVLDALHRVLDKFSDVSPYTPSRSH